MIDEELLKKLTETIIVGATVNVFSLLSIMIEKIEERKDLSPEDKLKVFKQSLDLYVEERTEELRNATK